MRHLKKIIFGLTLMFCYGVSYAQDADTKPVPPANPETKPMPVNVPQLKSFEKKDIEEFCGKICDSICANVPEVGQAECRSDCPTKCKEDVEREGEKRKNKDMNGGDKKEMPKSKKP